MAGSGRTYQVFLVYQTTVDDIYIYILHYL